MSDSQTIRIWLYPFKSTGKDSYKISDWDKSNFRNIITKKHIDILIDDKEKFCDKDLEKYLVNTVLDSKRKILVFMHSSTKSESNVNYFSQIIPKGIPYPINYFGNGNETNNRNYAALYEIIRCYQTEENSLFRVCSNIQDISSEESTSNFKELQFSEPEYSDDWGSFFKKIQFLAQRLNPCIKVWGLIKSIQTYQLIDLNRHLDFFPYRHNIGDLKFEPNTGVKLNIILAPGDLNYTEYSENLLNEIIQEKVISLNEKSSISSRSPLKNKPILLLCGKKPTRDSFFNSSIWSRIVEIDKGDDTEIEFNIALEYLFSKTRELGESLYDLTVCKEFIEYSFRLKQNAYLTGPHNVISPVVFSDENKANEEFKEYANDEKFKKLKTITNNTEIKLKVLFIDDYANSQLKITEKKQSRLNKQKIFNQLFETQVGLKIDLNCVENQEDFLSTIKKFKPDIILIDYSFGEGNETGSEFMKKLIDEKDIIEYAPFRKLRIFPTTSFFNAFIDDIRSKGIEFSGTNYTLSRGADLINTPFLFLQYFTKAVLTLVEETQSVVKSIEALNRIWKELHIFSWENICSNIIEYQDIYKTFEDSKTKIDDFLDAGERGGILLAFLNSITIESDLSERLHDKDNKERVLRHYELLLYNLAYRNYKGNEEIILFNSLMRS